jgi:hypothetical protein
MSWYAWKAQQLNRIFAEQGALGRPGRFTVESIRAAEAHEAHCPERQRLQLQHSPLIKEPDKSDISSGSSTAATAYECRVPENHLTSTRQTAPETRQSGSLSGNPRE